MSVRLNVGDAVLVHTDQDSERIGLIKYIGCIHGCDMTTEYVGIELTESIQNGHSGTIAGYQYFSSPKGHGFHTKLGSVIRKMLPSELLTRMRDVLSTFKKKLSEKEKYIASLESKISINCISGGAMPNRISHLLRYDMAGSSKRTSLVSGVSGASGYLPRRESLSLTTITESFMSRSSHRESTALGVIDEAKKRRQLKDRSKPRRRQSKSQSSTKHPRHTHSVSIPTGALSRLTDHETCSSSDSGYSSSSSEYTDHSLTDDDDDESRGSSMNTMKRRQSSVGSRSRRASQHSSDSIKRTKKVKKVRRKIHNKMMRDQVNVLKDRRQLRRNSDDNSLYHCPTIAMNSAPRQESMVKTNTNVQQIRSNRIAHNHSVTMCNTTPTTPMSPHDSNTLPLAHPVLIRPSSSPVFTTGSKNTPQQHNVRFNNQNLAPNPSSPRAPSVAVPALRNQSSGFVDVCYMNENSLSPRCLSPSVYGSSPSHSHNHHSSHSYQFASGSHSMQSSSTITVPSQIDLWSNPHHVQGSISPASPRHTPPTTSPHTPQQSETTQTAYFDPESFLNQRNQQMLIQQQQQQQQAQQMPSYNVVSIKYNHTQTQSHPHGLSLKPTLSAVRTGQRTNIQSNRTTPSGTAASNVALYGDSMGSPRSYIHHKNIYSMPNGHGGFNQFRHTYSNNGQSHRLSK